jgi:tRNA-splicing ligase RtcB
MADSLIGRCVTRGGSDRDARRQQQPRDAWPPGVRHPECKLYALTGPLAAEYLEAMGVAARYAWLNRVVLGEMVRNAFAEVLGSDGMRLVVDVPHNVVLHENGMNIHRKGATPAREGDFALIPGSMGDHSYIALGLGHADWLWSCSHGAGRRLRRQEMCARAVHDQQHTHWECIRCARNVGSKRRRGRTSRSVR